MRPASPSKVLRRYRTIAVMGASRSPEKEAHSVPRYLQERGYRIIPVNPSAKEISGEVAYPSLKEIPDKVAKTIEILEVFRPSDELPDVARGAVELKKRSGRPLVFWAQLGLQSDEAEEILDEAKIPYVMDACMRTVHLGLGRERTSAARRA